MTKPNLMPNNPNRKRIRLPDYDYSQNGEYFVTICTHNKKCLFGKIRDEKMAQNTLGKIVERWWQKFLCVRMESATADDILTLRVWGIRMSKPPS